MDSLEPEPIGVLEMFILALVEVASVDTLYRMRREVALEPGGVKSALQGLEKALLITRAEPSKRGKRTFQATELGRRMLNEHWATCLKDHPTMEAVLRAAMVAWWMTGPDVAAKYLRNTMSSRREQTKKLELNAAHLERSQSDPLSAYSWMRVLSEAHRRRAEADAFQSISQSLQELSTKNVNHS